MLTWDRYLGELTSISAATTRKDQHLIAGGATRVKVKAPLCLKI
jgi:hypothetical protein